MYIPVLKNRLYENKFLRENKYLFDSKNILPLIEIIELKIGRSECGLDDLISYYDENLKSTYFIDFFASTYGEYRNADYNKVQFSLDIRDESKYKYQDLLDITRKSEYSIPVISIKKAREFILDKNEITRFVNNTQAHKKSIALRISAELYDQYADLVNELLRNNDYLIYDINEESIESRFFDLHKMSSFKSNYKKIILHSPRPSNLNNGSYIDGDFTGLIDNSLKNDYSDYEFDGFADYAGLKNVLPSAGGNGQGAALGLFYVEDKNEFFSIKNADSSKGAKGHKYVINQAFGIYKSRLNVNGDCPAFDYIDQTLRSRNKSGSFGQWKYITILRYISQIKTVYN